MSTKELKLTRGQIEEIVGPDQRKVRVIEGLINFSIISDELVDGVWVTRWKNGRMEQFVTDPASLGTDTVIFPVPFFGDPPNITHGMFRSAGQADDGFTITALSTTGFIWESAQTANHYWRAVGRWRDQP